MEIIQEQDNSTKTARAKVEPAGQEALSPQCLSALSSLTDQLKQSGAVISGGDNHKGGYQMYFINGKVLWTHLPKIEMAILENDKPVKITTVNCA